MALESKWVYTIIAVTLVVTFIIIFGLLFAFRNKLKPKQSNHYYYTNKRGIDFSGKSYTIDDQDRKIIYPDGENRVTYPNGSKPFLEYILIPHYYNTGINKSGIKYYTDKKTNVTYYIDPLNMNEFIILDNKRVYSEKSKRSNKLGRTLKGKFMLINDDGKKVEYDDVISSIDEDPETQRIIDIPILANEDGVEYYMSEAGNPVYINPFTNSEYLDFNGIISKYDLKVHEH